jgi:hypothetical protein
MRDKQGKKNKYTPLNEITDNVINQIILSV